MAEALGRPGGANKLSCDNNIELNQKIMELWQRLLDIQIDYGNLIDENRAPKAQLEADKGVRSRSFRLLEDWS